MTSHNHKPINRIHQQAMEAEQRENIQKANDMVEGLKKSTNLLARITFNQQQPGVPMIPGPIVKFQTPGGLPPGVQACQPVLQILTFLAWGHSEEQIIKGSGGNGFDEWLTHEDIEACRQWWRVVNQVCQPVIENGEETP